jgi:hypothetical protein
MIATDFHPLYWRGIVIAAIVVVFVVSALVVRATLAAGCTLRSARLPAETTSGRCEGIGNIATQAPIVRDATRQAAANDPPRPDRFHKEAA